MSAKAKSEKGKSVVKHVYRSDTAIRGFVRGDACMEKSLDKVVRILRREGYKGRACPFKDEMALDLDNVEKLLKQGKSGVIQDETVDFVVCLEKDLLLLVEAKLRVDNAASISTNEICGKIRHSRDMLQACDNFVHFEKTVIVLLKDKNYQQNYRRLRNMLMPRHPDVVPSIVSGLYSDYFCL